MGRRSRPDFGKMGARTSEAATGLAAQDRAREEEDRQERARGRRASWPLDRIKPRPGGDTRRLNPEHVTALAESIEALGLLEPLVIDEAGHLLAGGHRLAALKLLDVRPKKRKEARRSLLEGEAASKIEALQGRLDALKPGEMVDLDTIPVRVIAFDAREDEERALAIETSENTQRRDYTRKEVVTLYHRLKEAGYTDRRGKPKKGERAAKPAIATVIGKSVRTVRRILNAEDRSEGEARAHKASKAAASLARAIRRFERAAEAVEDGEAVEELLELLAESGLRERAEGVAEALEGEAGG